MGYGPSFWREGLATGHGPSFWREGLVQRVPGEACLHGGGRGDVYRPGGPLGQGPPGRLCTEGLKTEPGREALGTREMMRLRYRTGAGRPG